MQKRLCFRLILLAHFSLNRYAQSCTQEESQDLKCSKLQNCGFLKAAPCSGLALEAFPARSASQKSSEQLITIIDLDKCDGCSDLSIPACVRACRAKNQARYPEPQKPVQPYWPQPKYEDFSNDRDNISRLTPYNWIYLQHGFR